MFLIAKFINSSIVNQRICDQKTMVNKNCNLKYFYFAIFKKYEFEYLIK